MAARAPTRAELIKRYDETTRELELLRLKEAPIVYVMRSVAHPHLYTVGSASNFTSLPFANSAAPSADDAFYFAPLPIGAEAEQVVGMLKLQFAPFKSSVADGYEIAFSKAKRAVDSLVVLTSEMLADGAPVAASSGGASGSGEPEEADARYKEFPKIVAFLKECIVTDWSGPPILKADLVALYRVWSQGMTCHSVSLLTDQLLKNPNVNMIHVGPTADGVFAFTGIKIKPEAYPSLPTKSQPVYQFLREMCVFVPRARIFARTLNDAYVSWHENKGISRKSYGHALTSDLRAALHECGLYYSSKIEIAKKHSAGWYGICLREEADDAGTVPAPRSFNTAKTRKFVVRSMPDGEAKIWPSVAAAARELGFSATKLKNLLEKGTPDNEGARYGFADSDVSGSKVTIAAGAEPAEP